MAAHSNVAVVGFTAFFYICELECWNTSLTQNERRGTLVRGSLVVHGRPAQGVGVQGPRGGQAREVGLVVLGWGSVF